MESDADFSYTGEDCVSLLDGLCAIEWVDDELLAKDDE